MFQAGAKVKDVAAQFGVQERTVYRWLATWYQHGVLKLPRMGRRKKMSAAAQEVLVRELDLCPKMFWDEVQWIVWARTGEIYSLSLVRKVAAEHRRGNPIVAPLKAIHLHHHVSELIKLPRYEICPPTTTLFKTSIKSYYK